MSGQGPAGWDTSTIAAVAALIVACVAMVIALLQVLQQYISSGTQVRLGDRLVFGLMPGGVYRKWSWTQFRFRVLYRIPDVTLQSRYPEGHKLYGSKYPLLPSLWRKREENEISVDNAGSVSFATLASNPLPQWWNGHVSFWDALTKIAPVAIYTAVESLVKTSTQRLHRTRLSSPSEEKGRARTKGDMYQGEPSLRDALRKRALSAYGDFGGPSEASWLSFWRRYQFGSDTDLFFEMREGDADRCPTDVQVVPMKVSLQDVVTAGCLLRMRVVRADQSKRTMQMEGPAGMLISSPHASLGTIIRFIPGHESVHRDLYRAQNPAFPHYLERIWGQISVAGRPLNHGDTQRIADDNFSSEKNSQSSSVVFVGRRQKRESRARQDKLHDDQYWSKPRTRQKAERKQGRVGFAKTGSRSTSVEQKSRQPAHHDSFFNQTSRLEMRKPRRPRISRREHSGAEEPLEDQPSEEERSSTCEEGGGDERLEENDESFRHLAWNSEPSVSEKDSSPHEIDSFSQAFNPGDSSSRALVYQHANHSFANSFMSNKISVDTGSIRVQSVDSFEFQELRERNAGKIGVNAGWTPLSCDEDSEEQNDEQSMNRNSNNDPVHATSSSRSKLSQSIADSESASSSDIREWPSVLAELQETEVFLRRELNEKMKKLRSQELSAAAKDGLNIDLTDLRQEIQEVRAEWQKSQQKIQRWNRKQSPGSLAQQPVRISQDRAQGHSGTEDAEQLADHTIMQDSLSPLRLPKTDRRHPERPVRSYAQYSAKDSDSGGSYLRRPNRRRQNPGAMNATLKKTISRPLRQPQDHRDCPGSAYWLCQSDIFPGFWITPYVSCVNTRLCVNGAFVFLEALKTKSDEDLLQWHYVDSGPLREAKNMIADGVSTWPLYAYNARGGSTRPQSGWRIDSRPFKSQQVMPIVLPEYNRESIRKPGGLHRRRNDEDLCELMAIDLWLNHAGDLDEIEGGRAELCRLTPALVREVIEKFETDIISLTFNQAAGNFQDVLDLAERICQYLHLGLRLSEAEEIYLLLALYRAMKVGLCMSAGIDTAPVIWVAFTGGSVFMV